MSDPSVPATDRQPAQPPEGEVLAGGPEAPRPRSGRRGLVVAASALAVAAVAGAAVAATAYLSGGGTQPEDLMPAGVLAYADLDLDPAAGQKANIARFLGHFGDLDARFGSADDWRAAALERLLASTDVDPAAVEPWLGDRFGVALLPAPDPVEAGQEVAGAPASVVVALQVTDPDAAETWLSDQLAGDGSVLVDQGYALVGSPGVDLSQVTADAAAGSLADSQAFGSVMDPLGDGVAEVFVDVPALQDALAALGPGLGLPYAPFGPSSGRTSPGPLGLVLRVEPGALEVRGSAASGAIPLGLAPTGLLRGLPGTTAVAIATTGAGPALAEQWEAVLEQLGGGGDGLPLAREIRGFEQRTGLALPDDVVTLLGEDLVLSLDGTATAEAPRFGGRVLTDPDQAARLVGLLQPLVARATGGFGVTLAPTSDGYVAASSSEYAAQLASGPGGFLDLPAVQAVLPDAAAAGQAAYVDLDVVADLLRPQDATLADGLDPLRALGITSVVRDGRWDVRLRLTLDG